MRSLITGVTGFVGSHLAEQLIDKNEQVFGLCEWRSPKDNLIKFLDKIELKEANLTDLSSLLKALNDIKPKFIYHLAAQSFVPASFVSPKNTLDVNIGGTLNLLEAIRILNQNPVILICSTADVYGDVKKGEVPISELNPARPASPYAVSKVACELIAKQYFDSFKIRSIITRAFNHTGPRRGEVFAESSFAKQIAEIEKGKRKPVIHVGNLKSVRTYADVKDIAHAYYLALRKGRPGEIYNIAGNNTVSIDKLLKLLISLSPMKNKIKVKIDKSRFRPVDVISKTPNDSKFRKISGWKPKIPLKKTLEDLLNYWRGRV